MNAIYGEEVRLSIHDAIDLINKVAERTLDAGDTVTSESSSTKGYYQGSIYINNATNDIWECTGTSWYKLGNIKGEKGDSVTMANEKTGLVTTLTFYNAETGELIDTATINDGSSVAATVSKEGMVASVRIYNPHSDDTIGEFTITDGLDGVSLTESHSKEGLVTTVTISNAKTGEEIDSFTITDGKDGVSLTATSEKEDELTTKVTIKNVKTGETIDTFKIKDGVDGEGNRWYRGTEIKGKASTSTQYPSSEVANAMFGDCYMNIEEGAVYQCSKAGTPSIAEWQYVMTLTGGGTTSGAWGDIEGKPFETIDTSKLSVVNNALTIARGLIPEKLSDLEEDDAHKTVTRAEKEAISNIPSKLSDLDEDATHRLVTDTEKEAWNSKADADDLGVWTGETSVSVGGTTVTITNEAINDDSIIDVYVDNSTGLIGIESQSQAGNAVTITFSALEETTKFKLHIW